jgi:hypothetical protein
MSFITKGVNFQLLFLCVLIFTFCYSSTLEAATVSSSSSLALSNKKSHSHVISVENGRPSRPFSGIVEGTVVATSSTSITIAITQKTYRGSRASSTQKTFVLMPNVRITSYIGIGSVVSLMLEHIGKDIGKVIEIRVESGGKIRQPSTHTY